MRSRFGDTFYFLALLNPKDGAHVRAVALASRMTERLVTTTWVLTELGDALAAPSNRPAFSELLGLLRSDPDVEIVPETANLFDRGVDLYTRRLDKAWSLTDCISFVVMTERGIVEALTGDHHFEQAGFRALLK